MKLKKKCFLDYFEEMIADGVENPTIMSRKKLEKYKRAVDLIVTGIAVATVVGLYQAAGDVLIEDDDDKNGLSDHYDNKLSKLYSDKDPPDLDHDGIPDTEDVDDDGDGIVDREEGSDERCCAEDAPSCLPEYTGVLIVSVWMVKKRRRRVVTAVSGALCLETLMVMVYPDFKDADSDNDGVPDNRDPDYLQPFCGEPHAMPDYYSDLHEDAETRWANGADELCHGLNVCVTEDNYQDLNKTEDDKGTCSRPDVHLISCDKDDTNKIRGGCPWAYACNNKNKCVPYLLTDHENLDEVNSVVLNCKNISESDIQNINGLTDFSGDDRDSLCSQYTNNVLTRCYDNNCREPSPGSLDDKTCDVHNNVINHLRISDTEVKDLTTNTDCMINSLYVPGGTEDNKLVPSTLPVCGDDGTCREYNEEERDILQGHSEYSAEDFSF